MTTYSIYLDASINEVEFISHQVDFLAGITPALPQVGDEIGFTHGNRHYWAIIEERFFDYAECLDGVNVFICLIGSVTGSSEVPLYRFV